MNMRIFPIERTFAFHSYVTRILKYSEIVKEIDKLPIIILLSILSILYRHFISAISNIFWITMEKSYWKFESREICIKFKNWNTFVLFIFQRYVWKRFEWYLLLLQAMSNKKRYIDNRRTGNVHFSMYC